MVKMWALETLEEGTVPITPETRRDQFPEPPPLYGQEQPEWTNKGPTEKARCRGRSEVVPRPALTRTLCHASPMSSESGVHETTLHA